MEPLLRLKMDKPSTINGFSLLECLFVLLIVSILALAIPTERIDSMTLFSRMLQMHCIQVQEQAFAKKEETEVIFSKHNANFNGTKIKYPQGIVCTPQEFHYNADGNISKGGRITCQNSSKSFQLVFQIGAGRVRIDL